MPCVSKRRTGNKEGLFMEKKDTTFAVIGCGQFGGSVVEELARQGADVLAIDCNEEVFCPAAGPGPAGERGSCDGGGGGPLARLGLCADCRWLLHGPVWQ